MNRAIKFRAWDGQKMIIPEYVSAIGDGEWFTSWVHVDIGPSGVGPLMQFTGLTDKNGKEIYEGDIVTWMPWSEAVIRRVAPVSFENGCFYTKWQSSKYRLGGWNPNSVQVIGNIHENPELLP